jgi:hypothetical protein
MFRGALKFRSDKHFSGKGRALPYGIFLAHALLYGASLPALQQVHDGQRLQSHEPGIWRHEARHDCLL